MTRPDPQNFRSPRVRPTDSLNKPFTLHTIQQTTYQGDTQLRLKLTFLGDDRASEMFVSNNMVMDFLNEINGQSYMTDTLELFQSNPSNRYYEIRWVDNPDDGIPF